MFKTLTYSDRQENCFYEERSRLRKKQKKENGALNILNIQRGTVEIEETLVFQNSLSFQ